MGKTPHETLYHRAMQASEELPAEAREKLTKAIADLSQALESVKSAEATMFTAEESLPIASVAFHSANFGNGILASAAKGIETAEMTLAKSFSKAD